MDSQGVNTLMNLYQRAIKSNKVFCLIEFDNDMINKAFSKVNHTLREDLLWIVTLSPNLKIMKLQINNVGKRFEVIGDFIPDNVNEAKDHYEEVVLCFKNVKKTNRMTLKGNQLTHIFRNDY